MYPYIFTLEIPWINITLQPRFYGLFYAISLILGYKILIAEAQRLRLPINEDQAMNCALIIFMAGLLGGRVYYVILAWNENYAHQPWWEVLAIWHGGLAIHGGILGGLTALYFYGRITKIPLPHMLDIGVLTIILGQAIGRWGNFTNGEAAGAVTTFWTGISFPPGSHIYQYAQDQPVHPTMLYESFGDFIIFGILWKLRTKHFRPGMLAMLYLILYSSFRASITHLRTDNQYLEWLGTPIPAPYVISPILIIAGLGFMLKYKLWKIELPEISHSESKLLSPQKAASSQKKDSRSRKKKNRQLS